MPMTLSGYITSYIEWIIARIHKKISWTCVCEWQDRKHSVAGLSRLCCRTCRGERQDLQRNMQELRVYVQELQEEVLQLERNGLSFPLST